MSNLSAYLPANAGLLPYWYLFTATAGLYNTIQNFMVEWQSKEIYSGKVEEVSPLACRIAGTWTGMTSIIRFLTAYNLSDPTVYKMGQATYLVALLHFGSELLVFRSVRPNRASISPLIIAPLSLLWTFLQRDYYVK